MYNNYCVIINSTKITEGTQNATGNETSWGKNFVLLLQFRVMIRIALLATHYSLSSLLLILAEDGAYSKSSSLFLLLAIRTNLRTKLTKY